MLGALVGFSSASSIPTSGNAFYVVDTTAHFFKIIALISTIVVRVMSLEYKNGTMEKYIPGLTPGKGLRRSSYSLPVFTCAGLVFHGLGRRFPADLRVPGTRHDQPLHPEWPICAANPTSLEAGVEYLILGALSTGFLVYGITWIFGVTGQTNLAAIAAAPASQTEEHRRSSRCSSASC